MPSSARSFSSTRSSSPTRRTSQPATAKHRPPNRPPRGIISAGNLYPKFNPSQHYYVVRCPFGSVNTFVRAPAGTKVQVGNSKARSGRFTVEVPVWQGHAYGMRLIRNGSVRQYHVRCLPVDFPKWNYQRFRPSEKGLFTVSIRVNTITRPWIVMFDTNGVPRWWMSTPTPTLWSQVLRDGTVQAPRAFSDGFGQDPRSAHEIRSLSGKLLRLVRTKGTITDGHEYEEEPNGDYYLDSYVQHRADLSRFGGPKHTWVVVAEIQEFNKEGKLIWKWNSWKHISLAETGRWWKYELVNPHPAGPGGVDEYDAVHPNSIDPWGKNQIILSTRHTDAVFGIQRSTGNIIWKLGGTHTPVSLKMIGGRYPPDKLFGGQHDVRIHKGGILSIHDNATHRGRQVRIAFYKLDLKNRTATFVGQLTDPQVPHSSHCCGSARQFPGGGWLVAWGDTNVVDGYTASKKLAWRLRVAASSYRAVPVPPGAVTQKELDQGLDAMAPVP